MPVALLGSVGPALTEAGMLVGAQDVSRFGPGAHTGETTAEVLAELGCRLVMIGHPNARATSTRPWTTAEARRPRPPATESCQS